MISHFLNQNCVIYNRIGFDEEGRSTYGEGHCVDCRIESSKLNVTSSDGNDTASGIRMYISADIKIGPDDKIKIKDRTLHVNTVIEQVDGQGRITYKEVHI